MKPHRFHADDRSRLMNEERRRFQPAEDIVQRAAPKAGDLVADLGCGNGYVTLPLLEAGCRVLALDAQKGMLDDLRGRVSNGHMLHLMPVLAELPALPFRERCLDHIFMVNVLHEFEDKMAMVQECHRTLLGQGSVTLVDFQKKETTMGPPLSERIAEADVEGLFSGFDIVAHDSFDSFYQFKFRKI